MKQFIRYLGVPIPSVIPKYLQNHDSLAREVPDRRAYLYFTLILQVWNAVQDTSGPEDCKIRLLLVLTILQAFSIRSSQCIAWIGNLEHVFKEFEENTLKQLCDMRQTMKHLARQTMMQQFAVEERVRSEGNSGIKVVRGMSKGPANFYEATHIASSVYSVHDHANFDRTIGLGEIIAVLNGVEFRTRHNDYKLNMPSTTSTDYHETEPIPFPEVPKAVTDLDNVDDQIIEMREWFKAFLEQNSTVRDYRPYFKPVLCYLEGAWTLDKELEEPFESDRHQIDASSWSELQNFIRYEAYTGTKNRMENFAFLPTTIMSVDEETGIPSYAQWNYRIICKPIDKDIPTSYMNPVDDVSFRASNHMTQKEVEKTDAQRFNFYEFDETRGASKFSLIDDIFYTIPGKDNVPGPLNQSSFGEHMFTMRGQPLNTGYYHRFFKFGKPDERGLKNVARGFNDANLWVAQTTQSRVAPIRLEVCKKMKLTVSGKIKQKKICEVSVSRFSYAIPLEIVYLSPLLMWNPYNLTINETPGVSTADGRNGRSKPLDGVDRENYYLTPAEFFGTLNPKSTDPSLRIVKVLDQDGVERETTASGTRVLLPEIEGVGTVRLRYPIAPVHGEGSSVWKELNALKFVLKKGNYFDYEDGEKEEEKSIKKKEVERVEKKEVQSVEKEEVQSVEKKEVQSVDKEEVQSVEKKEVQSVDKEEVQSVEKEEGSKKEEEKSIKKEEEEGGKKEEEKSIKKEEEEGGKKEEEESIKKEEEEGGKKEEEESIKKEEEEGGKKEEEESIKKEEEEGGKKEEEKSIKREEEEGGKKEEEKSIKKEEEEGGKKEEEKSIKREEEEGGKKEEEKSIKREEVESVEKEEGRKKEEEEEEERFVVFQMSPTLEDPPGQHTHEIVLTQDTYERLMDTREAFKVRTTESLGHSHLLVIRYMTKMNRFEYKRCDKSTDPCWDGHTRPLIRI